MTDRGETITLLDDEGIPHDFTLVDVVEVEARRYAVLEPEEAGQGAVVFRVEGDTLHPIDDDEEFDRVVDALRDLEEYDDLVVAEGEEAPEDGTDDDEADDEGASGGNGTGASRDVN